MPIYEFDCGQCGAGFQRLQKMADPDPEQCPSCGASGGVRRRVSAPSFRLAGSGWYETDFKTDKDTRRNLASGESAAVKSGDSDAKAAKPADSGSKASAAGASSGATAATTASSTTSSGTS